MKKTVSLFIAVLMIFALTACSSEQSTNNTAPADNSQIAQTNPTDNNSTIGNNSSRTLVVYYSATGNTKDVAGYIAKETGGDLFELVPVTPYTNDDLDWRAVGSRVNAEHEDESKRDIALVTTTPNNFEEYDTLYIGYPIWWGIAAWPVDNFIKANDFTGKTVIPFCTSASSGLGNSDKRLKDMADAGNWIAGMRFSSNVSEDDVVEWVKNHK